MKHSPLTLMIGLHYYCMASKYAEGDQAHANSQAVNEIKDRMIAKGLLEIAGSDVRKGSALTAWVEAICSVPFPVVRWVIPEEGE